VWLPSESSEPGAILSLLNRFNPKLPTDGLKVVKVEKTERVTVNVVILLNQSCLEPIAVQQNRLNYGFDEVQLRVYDMDKLAADILAACASYEPPCVDELEDEGVSPRRLSLRGAECTCALCCLVKCGFFPAPTWGFT